MNLERALLLKRLLNNSPFSSRELTVLIKTAPERYKNHYIEKRHGRGLRLISQPTSEIKFLQRLLIERELTDLPLHDAAVAYRKHKSIKDHASPHASARYLLKLDFRNFFPSLKKETLLHRFRKDTSFSENDIWILCQILCRTCHITEDLQLSIGAPSSPFISNYLLWEFDSRITSICSELDVRYTRYADDLAFSTSNPHTLNIVFEEVKALLQEMSYLGLELNDTKTVNVSKKNRRTLVGLTLANDGTTSIGRNEKRRLNAMMHALSLGKLRPEEISQLRGKLAFIHSIDKNFVMNLCTKYGFSKVSDVN